MKITKLYDGESCTYNEIDNSLINYGNIGFVGIYITKKEDNTISSFCSFPKKYKTVTNESLHKDVNLIVQSILKSKRCMEDVSNDDNLSGSSLLYVVNELVEEYYHNGIYKRFNKKYINGQSRDINFASTFSKKTPKILNNNIVYDEYIVSKKHVEENIISHAMAYIIKEGTGIFSFYFSEVIDTEFEINYSLFDDIDHLVEQLNRLKRHTFKDRDLHILNCIIDYFEQNLASSGTFKICTTNYNLVWQDMVQMMLGDDFKHEHKENIGLMQNQENARIMLDHYNNKEKIICDSKYYKDDLQYSYKELFYVYHMSLINLKNCNVESLDDIITENKKWTLRMITPSNDDVYNYNSPVRLLDRTEYDGFIQEVLYLSVYDVIKYFLNESVLNPIESALNSVDMIEQSEKYNI